MSQRSWRIAFTALLATAMAVSTFTMFALGALAPTLVDDLDLSTAAFGALGTAFFGVAAFTSPIVGAMVDRLGGRRVLLGLFAVTTASFLCMAVAPSYPWLALAVAVGGVAIAAGNPVTNLLIAQRLPAGNQGTVVGIKQSAVQVGAFVAGAALPQLADRIGWRGALASAAVAAGAGAVATVMVVRDDRSPQRRASRSRPAAVWAVRWLVPYAFFMGAGVSTFTAYVALYAHRSIGMSTTRAGQTLALLGGVAVVSRIAWGRFADRRPTAIGPLAAIAGLALLSAVLVWIASHASSWLLWLGVIGAGASAASWNAPAMLTVVKQAGPQAAGRASGHVLTGFYVGLLVSPLAFGVSVDATDAFDLGWGLATAMFAGALVVTALWSRASRRRAGVPSLQPSTG